MGREILLLVDALAREKNVDKEIVFGALELALASAAKKKFTEDVEVRASVDRATGEFTFFRRWEVVKNEEIEVPSRQYKLHEAQEEDPESQVGEFIEEPLEGMEVGRIGAQTAKQVIVQKIRDAEREQILNDFLARKEHLVTGVIKRMERGNAIVESGRLEAMLPRDQMIPGRKGGKQHAAHRRHAGGGGPRGFGTFDQGDALFQHLHRRVLQPAVGHARALTAEARGGFFGIVIAIA